jgi:hypothetical protein
MKNLVIYRVITYILLFVAAFFSVGVFSSLLAALANPVALLPVFLLACVIIYTYCSWRFLVRGIDKQIPLKPVLRDLIKVNGYITIALAALCLLQMIIVLTQPASINMIIEQARAAQPAGKEMTDEMLLTWTNYILRFLVAYSALLVIHTIITFRLLKRFSGVFTERES